MFYQNFGWQDHPLSGRIALMRGRLVESSENQSLLPRGSGILGGNIMLLSNVEGP